MTDVDAGRWARVPGTSALPAPDAAVRDAARGHAEVHLLDPEALHRARG